jgi:hypothetical protein
MVVFLLQMKVLMQTDNTWVYSLLSAPLLEGGFGRSCYGKICRHDPTARQGAGIEGVRDKIRPMSAEKSALGIIRGLRYG